MFLPGVCAWGAMYVYIARTDVPTLSPVLGSLDGYAEGTCRFKVSGIGTAGAWRRACMAACQRGSARRGITGHDGRTVGRTPQGTGGILFHPLPLPCPLPLPRRLPPPRPRSAWRVLWVPVKREEPCKALGAVGLSARPSTNRLRAYTALKAPLGIWWPGARCGCLRGGE